MKKPLMVFVALLFLAAVSVPVLAADSMPAKTPVAKSMKHKKNHKKGKKAAKPASTPMANK